MGDKLYTKKHKKDKHKKKHKKDKHKHKKSKKSCPFCRG